MPLDDTHTKTVGFVIGDDEVVGTFFVVQRSGKCFMLTAAHNLVPYNTVKTRIRTHDGSTLYEWDPGPWFFPDLDRGLDLAINCFDPASSEDLLFTAIPIDEQGMDVMGAHPKLGTTVYFAGLLAPVERMGEAGIPMVRSGSLGALYQPGVAYDESWGPMTAHLIDTRSWGGFSGSPCWWQMTYPGPAIGSKAASLTAEVPDDVELGDLHFLTAFLGLFLGHARESGAGVVLPVETIRDALEHEDLLAKCKDRADCTASNRQAVTAM